VARCPRRPGQRVLDTGRPERRPTHVDQADSRAAVGQHRRDGDDGPVLRPAVELLERPPGVGDGRDPDLDQHLVGRQRGLQEPGEEVVDRDLPFAAGPPRDERRSEGQQRSRQVRRRVAVGDRPADGAAVPHLRIADLCRDLGQQRHPLAQHAGALQVVVAGQRADPHRVAVLLDVRQVADAPDVDQYGGHRQPQPHQRQQRVPSGQQLGIVAVLGQQAHGLVDRRGPLVVERCGDHRPASCA
jgi:hypothetical protein